MKRLHKIAVIFVALVAVVISGCKGKADMDKAPCLGVSGYGDSKDLKIVVNDYTSNIKFKTIEDQENFIKRKDKDFSNLVVKSITMTGRRECKIGKVVEWNYNDGRRESLRAKIVNVEDCPPKDRLSGSWIVKLKTNYGTFTYDTGNESTRGCWGNYKPIK